MSNTTCGGCRRYVPVEEAKGLCWRYPPHPFREVIAANPPNDPEIRVHGHAPFVGVNTLACGEYGVPPGPIGRFIERAWRFVRAL